MTSQHTELMSTTPSTTPQRTAQEVSKLDPNFDRQFKRTSLFDAMSQTTTLIVGKDEVPFIIHKQILCDASPVFKAACKPEWIKAYDQKIKLPEDEPEVVKVMAYWMYHDVLCLPAKPLRTYGLKVTDGLDNAPGLLAKVFVLGEKYQISRLRNDVIDAFVDFVSWHDPTVPAKVIPYLWDNTSSESCQLRKLIVECARVYYTCEDFMQARAQLPADFLFDLSRAFCVNMVLVNKEDYGEDDKNVRLDFCSRSHSQNGSSQELCDELKEFVLDMEDDE